MNNELVASVSDLAAPLVSTAAAKRAEKHGYSVKSLCQEVARACLQIAPERCGVAMDMAKSVAGGINKAGRDNHPYMIAKFHVIGGLDVDMEEDFQHMLSERASGLLARHCEDPVRHAMRVAHKVLCNKYGPYTGRHQGPWIEDEAFVRGVARAINRAAKDGVVDADITASFF